MDHLPPTRTSTDSSFAFSRALTVPEVLFAASTHYPLDDLLICSASRLPYVVLFLFVALVDFYLSGENFDSRKRN